jgi:hypothetical protein
LKDDLVDKFGTMMPNLPEELKKGLHLNRTSYFCCINECPQCDETIKYEFDHDKQTEIEDARTGKISIEHKKVHIKWDPQQNGQILANGELQDPQNTPEGMKCECFCHMETRRQNMAENKAPVAKTLNPDLAEKLT